MHKIYDSNTAEPTKSNKVEVPAVEHIKRIPNEEESQFVGGLINRIETKDNSSSDNLFTIEDNEIKASLLLLVEAPTSNNQVVNKECRYIYQKRSN